MERLLIFLAALSAAHSATTQDLANIGLRCYNKTAYVEKKGNETSDLLNFINPSWPTHIYIHGATNSPDSNASQTVIQAYLLRGYINTCAVNWTQISNENDLCLAFSVQEVAIIVANALDNWKTLGFNTAMLVLVGHSLGAEICGLIGRSVTFTVPRITGLDPAPFIYEAFFPRLQITDASFVTVIHVAMGTYGGVNTYHCDFYPNGGYFQPGCQSDPNPACSHLRGPIYYGESVTNDNAFIGVQCGGFSSFELNQCVNNTRAIMGFGTSKYQRGWFYLRTNSTYPYGLGEQGTIPT